MNRINRHIPRKSTRLKVVLLAFLALVTTLFYACKEDKCEGKRANSAFRAYQMLEYVENTKTLSKEIEEDTFMIGTYVTFEALGYADTYEWQLGEDTNIRTGKKITIFFNPVELLETTNITVTLKATINKNSLCFPGETSTSSKTITLLDNAKWPVIGKYYGSDNTAPDKKYTIEIIRGVDPGYYATPGDISQYIKNLPDGCSDTKFAYIGGAAFEFKITDTQTISGRYLDCDYYFFKHDKKLGFLSPDRKNITIDYIFTLNSEDTKIKHRRVFTGKKIE